MFNKISRSIYKIEVALAQIILSLIVILVFSAAIARSMSYPIIWSVEIAKILFMIICFLCIDITLKKNKHIGITYFVEKLKPKAQTAIQIFVLLLMLAFTIFSIDKGVEIIELYKFRLFNATGIPYRYVMLVIPLSMVLMSITIMAHIENRIRSLKAIKNTGETERSDMNKKVGV
ncbi:TRAP transporter small permease [Marinomonas gallaica]|uniref:TRAP transporter small permease n=1 Tax=Marinomonas gallaica TaxID=1806667 RepID=UPI003CE4E80A